MKNSEKSLIVCADGSHTLYLKDLEEHYHSVNGAIQESQHVFIREGLLRCHKSDISVLEFGFGTGLNALLTMQSSRENQIAVQYQTIEKYPLDESLAIQLNYCEHTCPDDQSFFMSLHTSHWDEEQHLTEHFRLHKIRADFRNAAWINGIDVVYFDAFAPNKQPENWDEKLFQRIYDSMNNDGIFVTYCAKGEVRRQLQRCGFIVERIPGPPGKREMLRGIKKMVAD